MTHIAMLGLGAMGHRMARRLLADGHEVTVWNRTLARADALIEAGARVANNPREAASGAQVVWAMVFDDVASRDVWLDPNDGALRSLRSDAIAIESSTLTPAWILQLNAAVKATGASFLDAPVAGSRPQADAGQLTFMIGGEASVLDRVRPLLAALGPAVHHLGPAGSGALLKLTVNSLFAIQVAAVAEQLCLLQRAGLEGTRALDALRTMPVMSPAAAGAAALMLAGDYKPQAPIELIAKDLRYALAKATTEGTVLPLTTEALRQFEAAQAAGWGKENIVAVAKLFA